MSDRNERARECLDCPGRHSLMCCRSISPTDGDQSPAFADQERAGDAPTHDDRVEYEERILAVEMENERLKRALKPFAVKCILWAGEDRAYARDSHQIQHRLGDFRAAHRLIYGEAA